MLHEAYSNAASKPSCRLNRKESLDVFVFGPWIYEKKVLLDKLDGTQLEIRVGHFEKLGTQIIVPNAERDD
jgi:hypothetical protein